VDRGARAEGMHDDHRSRPCSSTAAGGWLSSATPPAESAAAKLVTARTVFANRRFRLLWSAQLVSSIGDALVDIAAAILVYRVTESTLAVGAVLMTTAAPPLLIGLFAGVFVDRYDRKWILVTCDVLRGAIVLTIPWLITFGIGWIYVAIGVVSAIGTFFNPAHSSVLPEIAEDDELAAANSVLSIGSVGSSAVGFVLGGVLAVGAAIEWAFYLDAITFFVSAMIVSRIAIPKHGDVAASSGGSVVRNLRAGLTHLWERRVLRALLVLATGVTLAAGLHSGLQLPFTIEILGASEGLYGLLQASFTVAFMAGAFVMALRAERLRDGEWLTLALIGMGGAGMAFSIVTTIPLAIGLFMLSGFLMAPFGVAGQLIIARQTTREMRGRVSSALGVVQSLAFLGGFALVGFADVFDVRLVYLVASIAVVLMGAVAGQMAGFGQPASEWHRAVALLRAAARAPRLDVDRARGATASDVDALASHLPLMGRLSPDAAREFASEARVLSAAAGTTVLRRGEASDAAYFVLAGRLIAGWEATGDFRPLESLAPGDVFGEIAVLTGAARSASIVVDEDAVLLEVPADAVRRLGADPGIGALLRGKMRERRLRMETVDLPQFARLGARALRELRTDDPGEAPGDAVRPEESLHPEAIRP
jgi:MFS transporter, DHA3 family, macrolide efflux protein